MQKPDDTEEVVDIGEYDDVMELLGKDSKNLHRMGLFTGIIAAYFCITTIYDCIILCSFIQKYLFILSPKG